MISFQADIAKEPCFGQENVRKVFFKEGGVHFSPFLLDIGWNEDMMAGE